MVNLPVLRLAHNDRIDALVDHADFFRALGPADLDAEIPACPGWTVEDVVRHVASFAAACRAWCEVDALNEGQTPMALSVATMASVQAQPLGQLLGEFDRYESCLRGTEADTPVWGHLGRETAGWQSWHCASEWGVHRHDVEAALGCRSSMDGDRAGDALVWTTDYVFGLIQFLRGLDPFRPIRMTAVDLDLDYVVGLGEPLSSFSGSAGNLTLHLWRRPHGPITIEGDPVVAREYSSLGVGG